jgi:hypothetical protein
MNASKTLVVDNGTGVSLTLLLYTKKETFK